MRGVRNDVVLADHVHHERLARGQVHDVREAEHKAEQGDVPVLDEARRDEEPAAAAACVP